MQARHVSNAKNCARSTWIHWAAHARVCCRVSTRVLGADTAEGRAKAGKHRRTGSWFTRAHGGEDEENYRRVRANYN